MALHEVSSTRVSERRVAVLYQALPPPVVNNVQKPIKPGGYRDSGADIAYNLRARGVDIVAPVTDPSPEKENDWCFPDDEEGILAALRQGATDLWANTILFGSHPLQTSEAILRTTQNIRIVGQPPTFVEVYDDKNLVNSILRSAGGFSLPRFRIVTASNVVDIDMSLPAIGKPIRGRGSHGVKLCHSRHELLAHVYALLEESPEVMVEEYLSGQETTVTVMPPTEAGGNYTALPVVERYNHADGIAPYSGKTAVSANSGAVSESDFRADKHYQDLSDQCTRAAQLLKVTAPIRIDARRYSKGSEFALFDVNMKPVCVSVSSVASADLKQNMTGPGRPNRDDQASLTALAAAELGWTYSDLLLAILDTARTLTELRAMRPTVLEREGPKDCYS